LISKTFTLLDYDSSLIFPKSEPTKRKYIGGSSDFGKWFSYRTRNGLNSNIKNVKIQNFWQKRITDVFHRNFVFFVRLKTGTMRGGICGRKGMVKLLQDGVRSVYELNGNQLGWLWKNVLKELGALIEEEQGKSAL
jgi:hypothetical protein